MLHLSNAQSHFVDHGRVWCPDQGDIDVERCLDCPRLKSAELTGRQPQIACDVLRPSFWRSPEEMALFVR